MDKVVQLLFMVQIFNQKLWIFASDIRKEPQMVHFFLIIRMNQSSPRPYCIDYVLDSIFAGIYSPKFNLTDLHIKLDF